MYVCMYVCMYVGMYVCMYVRTYVYVCIYVYVTGYWKTDHVYAHLANCFLLAQLIATLIHYHCTATLMG